MTLVEHEYLESPAAQVTAHVAPAGPRPARGGRAETREHAADR